MATSTDDGFYRFPGRPNAGLRLFCFPYAGGNAQVFEDLADALPSEIETIGIDYPGRRSRFGEEPVHKLDLLVADLARSICPYLDRPFAFYGHSNGALVAYEMAKIVPRLYYRSPNHVILGAKRSPVLGPETPLHTLPDDEFIERLRDYRGTPEGVLTCPDVMDVYLPILRADFALSETYHPANLLPVDAPIHAIAGRGDALASPGMMQEWRPLTSSDFVLTTLEAEHFFLSNCLPDVVRLLAASLLPDSAKPSPGVSERKVQPC